MTYTRIELDLILQRLDAAEAVVTDAFTIPEEQRSPLMERSLRIYQASRAGTDVALFNVRDRDNLEGRWP
jgi:hypothetical protein